MNDVTILLFIPMYNCRRQIVRVLAQIDKEVLEHIDKILIVNNRSTDNGEAAVIDYAHAHPDLPIVLMRNRYNYGGGGSHKVAFNYAVEHGFDFIIVLHGDDQGNIKDLLPYIISGEALRYDAFLGSRFLNGSKLINYSRYRILGNHIFNAFMTVVLRKRIYDLGAGLNMYSVDFLKSKFYMSFIDSLTFYVYLLIYIVDSNARFKYFSLMWREDDQISNAKFFKQSKEILEITFNYVINKKKAFMKTENKYSNKEYKSEIVYEQ